MLTSIRLVLAASLILISAFPPIAPAWAARSPNEIPLYAGGLTPEQQKFNESWVTRIVREAVAHGMTQSQLTQKTITRGWQYLKL